MSAGMVPDTKEDSMDIYDGLDDDPCSNRGIYICHAFYISLQEENIPVFLFTKIYAYTRKQTHIRVYRLPICFGPTLKKSTICVLFEYRRISRCFSVKRVNGPL